MVSLFNFLKKYELGGQIIAAFMVTIPLTQYQFARPYLATTHPIKN